MWTKVMLMAAATFLLLSVVESDKPQENNDVEKRNTHTLSYVVKMIQQITNRLTQIESQRPIVLRGKDGAQGKPGPRGPQGAKGGGVEYIRWGKTTCPSGADFVYKGHIGGDWYDHNGGGANYVCLHETPKYASYKSGFQDGADMYGTEYQTTNLFSNSQLYNHAAPCVACHVKTRSSKLMIPARYDCPAGWTREYHGYLMAERDTHKNNKVFICVDRDADVVPGTKANENGALLYPVEGHCGSLPCRPYVADRSAKRLRIILVPRPFLIKDMAATLKT